MKMKTILLAIAGLTFGSTAHAAWTQTGGDSFSLSGTYPNFSLTGGNNGHGETVYYGQTFGAAATLSFDWSYSTVDYASIYDPAGYQIDSDAIIWLANSDRPGASSGSASVALTAGQTFRFLVSTPDGRWGPGTLSVSHAVGGGAPAFAPVPEPSAVALLGLGTVGLVARRRRSA